MTFSQRRFDGETKNLSESLQERKLKDLIWISAMERRNDGAGA